MEVWNSFRGIYLKGPGCFGSPHPHRAAPVNSPHSLRFSPTDHERQPFSPLFLIKKTRISPHPVVYPRSLSPPCVYPCLSPIPVYHPRSCRLPSVWLRHSSIYRPTCLLSCCATLRSAFSPLFPPSIVVASLCGAVFVSVVVGCFGVIDYCHNYCVCDIVSQGAISLPQSHHYFARLRHEFRSVGGVPPRVCACCFR